MGMFDFLKRDRSTAETAKNRLQVLIAQSRQSANEPDYLPILRQELLAVIKKYVKGVDDGAVNVAMQKDGSLDVLDIRVDLPES
ncbi:cell division topological specificity factor MinE [Luteimonas sp. FXH3W]|jgi:cell division topological specificity factor|uniref:Cell division topological specificity factor n=1 Tax=Aquilutibacter rugosus TaxID=3115820 RepID=A0ABU7V3T8_9GAMM